MGLSQSFQQKIHSRKQRRATFSKNQSSRCSSSFPAGQTSLYSLTSNSNQDTCCQSYGTPPNKQDTTKYVELFHIYTTGKVIDSNGLCQIINDLGIEDLSDMKALWVAWKFKVRDFIITETDFIQTLKEHQCSDLNDFKKLIPNDPLDNSTTFKKLFIYAFISNLGVAQKRLEIADAIELLLQFYGNDNSKVNHFISFLNTQSIKTLSKDEWTVFYDFVNIISADFSNYDQNSSWPLLFDNYVEFSQAND
ncbi:Defective in cullin neddylation protein [Entamoeba marina]